MASERFLKGLSVVLTVLTVAAIFVGIFAGFALSWYWITTGLGLEFNLLVPLGFNLGLYVFLYVLAQWKRLF